MNETDILRNLCEKKLEELGWSDRKSRLNEELRHIDDLNESEYYLKLYNEKYFFEENEHNLLTVVLLGLCENYNKEKSYEFINGDSPDIDTDYLPPVRDYLKQDYCPNTFGREYVCNISTYTKFGIRSSLIDMARVLGLDRKEIIAITTELAVKDDDGEVLTWDKAIELYDDLKKYLDDHPDLADAAKKLLHRNRGIGVHASGLIISGMPLNQFVPLVKPKQDGQIASAWVEGLGGSDLGAVGLVKFDFLGLDACQKIAQSCYMAAEAENILVLSDLANGQNPDLPGSLTHTNSVIRTCHENEKVSALPGQHSWSDLSYLEDPKSIEMANRADLKMIFQFDGSPAIRRLVRQGGVTQFNDLVAYTSLFRPGPMKYSAHTSYCERKQGREKYEVHPLLEDILGYTYGIITYQEQCMRLLNLIGKIPLKDCEAVRKAISKKKIDNFLKYKEVFIENGQKTLNWGKDAVEKLWASLEAFSGYAFNFSHAVAYCYVSSRMLYLKAHKPKGFFPAFINNTKCSNSDDYLKMKEYIQEADKNGIEIKRVDYNNSRAEMKYENGCCHYPFSKIKGIGEDTAKRIEQLQPYSGFEDFLARFGTEAKVCSALIALRAIPGDPLTLWEFYEKYKTYAKKQVDVDKRFESSNIKFNSEVLRLTKRDLKLKLCKEDLAKLYTEFPEGDCNYKKSISLYKRFIRVLNNYNRNKEIEKPIFSTFKPTGEIENEEMKTLLSKPIQESDIQFIGFPWKHPIEEIIKNKNKNEKIITFEDFDLSGRQISEVDVLINKLEERTTKKGGIFYSLEVEDSSNRKKWITVWDREYKQFADKLIVGNVIRITVKAPTPPFSSLTIAPSTNKWIMPPKEKDFRVIVMND